MHYPDLVLVTRPGRISDRAPLFPTGRRRRERSCTHMSRPEHHHGAVSRRRTRDRPHHPDHCRTVRTLPPRPRATGPVHREPTRSDSGRSWSLRPRPRPLAAVSPSHRAPGSMAIIDSAASRLKMRTVASRIQSPQHGYLRGRPSRCAIRTSPAMFYRAWLAATRIHEPSQPGGATTNSARCVPRVFPTRRISANPSTPQPS